MAKVDLKALREQLKKEQAQKEAPQGDNASYPFWNISPDETAALRFLPDGDDENLYFWRERAMINLTFDGIAGQPNTAGKEIKVQVPCMEMYGDNKACPVLTEARKFYKSGNDELGQRYWKKRSYIFQGFVRNSPFTEDNPPENPIRRFMINPSIYKIIFQYIMDDDNENSPTDYENGCDFRVSKTKNGEYDNYSTSNFSRKDSPLTEEELESIEKYGLFNLADFLPKEPDGDQIKIIQEMFESSLDGEPYDPDRFASYYRPFGLEFDNNSTANSDKDSAKTKSTATSKNDDNDDNEEEKPSARANTNTTSNSKPSAQELLAKLRNK